MECNVSSFFQKSHKFPHSLFKRVGVGGREFGDNFTLLYDISNTAVF